MKTNATDVCLCILYGQFATTDNENHDKLTPDVEKLTTVIDNNRKTQYYRNCSESYFKNIFWSVKEKAVHRLSTIKRSQPASASLISYC